MLVIEGELSNPLIRRTSLISRRHDLPDTLERIHHFYSMCKVFEICLSSPSPRLVYWAVTAKNSTQREKTSPSQESVRL